MAVGASLKTYSKKLEIKTILFGTKLKYENKTAAQLVFCKSGSQAFEGIHLLFSLVVMKFPLAAIQKR